MNLCVDAPGAIVDPIFDFRLFIFAKEMLLLQFVRFLADVDDLSCDDMPALRPSAVAIVAVEKFSFRPEMILGQCLSIAFELIGRNWLAGFSIECGPAASRTLRLKAAIGFTSNCFRGRPRLGFAHCSKSGNSNCGGA